MKTLNKFDISSFIAPMKANYDTYLQCNVTQWHSTGFPQVTLLFRRKTATVQQLQCVLLPGGYRNRLYHTHYTSVLCENPESKCEIARNYIGFSSLFQIFDNVTPTWKTDQPKQQTCFPFFLFFLISSAYQFVRKIGQTNA